MFFQSSLESSTFYTSGHCVLGDGGGGDGSSGSEEDGNDGGVSTIPPLTGLQTTYDVLRGLGIVGGSGTGENEHQLLSQLPGLTQFVSNVHSQVTHFPKVKAQFNVFSKYIVNEVLLFAFLSWVRHKG